MPCSRLVIDSNPGSFLIGLSGRIWKFPVGLPSLSYPRPTGENSELQFSERPPSKMIDPATPEAQEAPVIPSRHSDWVASSAQAIHGGGAVAGAPQASFLPPSSPYMRGNQHVMSPHGISLPYADMYAPVSMYGHHAMTQGTTIAVTESEWIPSYEKGQSSAKELKGNLGDNDVVKRYGDDGKATLDYTNEDSSWSSGSESASSNASDEETDPQDFSMLGKRSYDGAFAKEAIVQKIPTALYSGCVPNFPVSVHGEVVVTAPATNLSMGMDFCHASYGRALPMEGRPDVDEHELKKQKRKQSNRESARRSRMRRQKEYDDLSKMLEDLKAKEHALVSEIDQVNEDKRSLQQVCLSLEEELTRVYGREVLSEI